MPTRTTLSPPLEYTHLATAGIISDDWFTTLNPSRGRFATCEQAGARPDSNAILTKEIINSVLADGGNVSLLTDGTFYISGPLIVPSNTRFWLGPKTRIQLQASQQNNLLRNQCYQNQLTSGFSSCTLSWTAGNTCTVTWTAHGLSAGDYVFIFNSTLVPSNFRGVFLVLSVSDADTLVIQLNRTPSTSPSGTASIIQADKNIEIIGGIWDQDFPTVNNGSSALQERAGILLCGVANLSIKNIQVEDCAHYSVNTCGTLDLTVDGIWSPTNQTSILKVYGPANFGVIRRVTGYSADDGISLQTKDASAFIGYQPAWGDVTDFKIYDSDITSTANIVALFGSSTETFGSVQVDGICGASGSSNAGVLIAPSYTLSVIDEVYVRNVKTMAGYTVAVRNNGLNGTVNKLVVEQLSLMPDQYNVDKNMIFTDTSVGIVDFYINSLNCKNAAWPSTATYICNLNHSGAQVKVNDAVVDTKNTNGNFMQSLGNITTISFDRVFMTSNCAAGLRIFGATGAVNITGSDLGCQTAVAPQSTCAVNVSANRIACTGALVRSNTTTKIQVFSSGNNWANQNVLSIGSTTGKFEFYGMDIPLDLGATGVQNSVPGQYALSAVARGTIQTSRIATCTGTSWAQIDTTSQIF